MTEILILDENFDGSLKFRQNMDCNNEKIKISIFDKSSDFLQKFRFFTKVPILYKSSVFLQKFRFLTKVPIFHKSSVFYKNSDFWQKFRFLTEISILGQHFHFYRYISFLDQFSKLVTDQLIIFIMTNKNISVKILKLGEI